jgi:oxygen-dependent protoporphyrinogen oxidase
MPAGTVLGVPVDGAALPEPMRSAVLAEPKVPGAPLAPGADVSVGDLVRRRYGQEVLDRLVDPLLGGINAGDSDRLSLRAAAPQIAAAAERSASLVEGLRAQAAAAPTDPAAPVFWALPDGMAALVAALEAALRGAGVLFSPDPLTELGPEPTVLAVPAPVAAGLVGGEAAAPLRSIGHASPVLTTMAFRRDDVRHPLDASGLLVPRVEGRLLTACTFASTKWAHLDTGDGLVVLRASAGRYGDDRAIDAADDDLVDRLLADLDDLLGLAGAPTEVRVSRWRDGFPQYEPGHLAKVEAVERALPPNVRLAGAPYRGIGIPACIKQGRDAAAALVP